MSSAKQNRNTWLFLAFLLMAVLCVGCKKKKADTHAATIADDPSIVDINSENKVFKVKVMLQKKN